MPPDSTRIYGYLLLGKYDIYYSIVLYIVGLISLLVSSGFILIIATKSPSFMKTYKYLLLNMYVWCIFCVFHLGIWVQPNVVSPFACFKINGLARYFADSKIHLLVYSTYISMGNFIMSAALIFFYKATLLYHHGPKWLTFKWTKVALALILHLANSLYVAGIIYFGLVPSKTIMENPLKYSFCLDFYMSTSLPLFAILFIAYMVGITLICSVIMLKIAKNQASTGVTSRKRIKLNRKMNVTLIVLFLVTVGMGFFPCSVVFVFMFAGFNYTNAIIFFTLPIAVAIPIGDSIVLVVFIKPYRSAVLSCLKAMSCSRFSE
ncbi:hypothetical protein L596_016100 [Steinernema carpocapsae]|uniref:G-protein coupled receptors family 1 profile domain-containing protein n=1 Tax=Steinernema carpocapsae TaxID=34508 RepID=A0A4U5NI24_STECR|nr:hypothetical protein L596_016100 [Steinernema carpocapsae]